MSDDQPHKVGSRRRRREIREARERARAAQRERESAVRRLSTSSTADPASGETSRSTTQGTGSSQGAGSDPSQRAQSEQSEATPPPRSAPSLINQESESTQDEHGLRRRRTPGALRKPVESRNAPDPQSSLNGQGSTNGRRAAGASQTPREQSPGSDPYPQTDGFTSRRERRLLQTQQTPVQAAAGQHSGGGSVDDSSGQMPPVGSGSVDAQASSGSGSSSSSAASGQESSQSQTSGAGSNSSSSGPAGDGGETSSQNGDDSQPTPLPVSTGVPSTSSPSTPFEDVVTGNTPVASAASSPDEGEDSEAEEQAEYYEDDVEHHDTYEPSDLYQLGDFGEAEWDEEYGGYIEHDENGMPVLVGVSDFGRGYQTVKPLQGGRISRTVLKARQAKRRRRNITLTAAVVGFIILMVGFVVIIRSLLPGDDDEDYDAPAGDTVAFEVVQGDGIESVTTELVDQEIVASREAFQDAVQELGQEPVLHPGTFELREELPAEDAAAALFEDEASHYFHINPGDAVEDVLDNMAAGTDMSREELEELNEDPQEFGLPEEADTLEGYLAPGEYRPEVDAEPADLIEEAVGNTFDQFEDLGLTDEQEQWEAVIKASLIEREANHEAPEEYREIAGAIENRLSPDNDETDGMLQVDAAVHYGLEGETGVHFDDETREDDSNPYNTYQHEGLPPGPIAMPGAATLEAAADPADNDYFFWVTVDLETGETRFNETYEEHLEDEDEFLRWCEEEDEDELCGPSDVEEAEEGTEEE